MTAAEAQIRAAEPRASSWVSANAGSGKTRVLTDRVARLLLAGTDPGRILCLTYTKAAAAEMQNRLFARLGKWAMLDDAALIAELRALGEPAATLAPDALAGARTLFARALETPGGLKIETIHAFCDALLRRFPLEAGVPPGFAVIEDRQARDLRETALESLALADPARVEALARHLAGDDPDALLAEIATERARFAAPLDAAALARALGHTPGHTLEALAAAVLTPAARALLAAILPDLAAGRPSDMRAAAKLAEALAADPARALAALEDVFLTGATAAEPFTAKRGSFPTRDTRAALGAAIPALDALMAQIEATRPRRLARAAYEKSLALNAFARAWLREYEAAKVARGRVDFDDLIARAVALLSDPATAAFVLWRLDGGLDHVLVDEAQDTSPAQWRVIEALTDDFFTGLSARDVARTIFVVGDEKQSIYSFQGADPAAFADMRAHFARQLTEIGAELARCDLLHSFRSAPPILALVDAVFDGPAGDHFADPVTHHPVDPDRPGRVELWPFRTKPERPEEPPWDRPLDLPMPDDPTEALAAALAAEIRAWLDTGRRIPGDDGAPRPVRPGDILILVQRRSTVFHPVIRALKRAAVPVAGADLLRIGAELAVKDLLAALRIAVTPADDLTLAALLRSPLCGLSEAELFRLAHDRPRRLIDALAAAPHAEARALIADLRAQADYLRPYEMLERLLVRHDGRRRLVARLGAEAEDGIDALLAQALTYETVAAPSLTGFLAWMTRGELEVKRPSDDGADEVRVMTVHGAKGLEAPIVILPDTARRNAAARRPELLPLDDLAAWSVAAAEAPPPLAAAEAARRARLEAENRRLLYVALTRARNWLIVCGAGDRGREEHESWHATVEAALARLGAGPEGDRLVLARRWPDAAATPPPLPARPDAAATPPLPAWPDAPVATPPDAPGTARPDGRDAPAAPPPLPAWTAAPPPAAPEVPRPRAPSALGGAHALPGEGLDEAEARARGSRLHRLLEGLAGLKPAARAAGAARLLDAAPDLAELLAEAEAVLDAPELAPLFAPGARAEVAISAPLAAVAGARILGRIDRLVVTPSTVLAADFKSNRVVPATPEDTPEAILRQMGAYAAALTALYPGRGIETALVWTRAPRLMRLPPALTAAALARAAPP